MTTSTAIWQLPGFFSSGELPEPRIGTNHRINASPSISQSLGKQHTDTQAQARLREHGRAQRLRFYLTSLIQKGVLSRSTAILAWEAWRILSDALSGNLIVPDAGATPDGQLLFTWNNNEHHFELEVFPSGIGEFFYLNHRTDETWENDYQIGDPLPDPVKDRLSLFVL